MKEGVAVVDEWSRERTDLTHEGIKALAATYCALCFTSIVLFVPHLAATYRTKRSPLLKWSIIALTIGTNLCLPAVGWRVGDSTVVHTDSWAVCILFFVGDLIAHWGLLGFGYYMYVAGSRRVFVLQPQRSALLASRYARLCLIVGALQPFTIGGVVGSGLPGTSAWLRKTGLQVFWIVQVSVMFGMLFNLEIIPAARSVLRFHSELAEETPASLRREIRIAATILISFSLATLLNIPLGLACAFLPLLYNNSATVYFYYMVNLNLLIGVGAMAAEIFIWVARLRDESAKKRSPIRKGTLSRDYVLKALDSSSSKNAVSYARALGSISDPMETPQLNPPTWERGVALELLQTLAEIWGGCEGMTTAEVCHTHVMAATRDTRCSLWVALKAACREDPGENPEASTLSTHLGKPTVFVSHSWSSQFLDILSIMRNYNKNSQRDNVFFFDVVSMNQHDLAELECCPGDESADLGSIMLENLRRSISAPGRVLLAMTPHDQPALLTRAWCLYEMHVAYTQKAKMTCGYTEEAEVLVLESLTKDELFLQSLLDTVDSSKAMATMEADRIMILARIEKTGIKQFNQFIKTRLRSTLSLLMSGVSADA